MSELSNIMSMTEDEAKQEFKQSILFEQDCIGMLKNPFIRKNEKRVKVVMDDIMHQSIKREYLKLYLWGGE